MIVVLIGASLGTSLARSAERTPLVVDARLVDTGRRVPACGTGHFITVMRCQVLHVVEGRYDSPDLFVAQSCPDFGWGSPRARFRTGDTYRLSLQPWTRGRWPDGSLVDAFVDNKQPRYVAVAIAAAPG